MKNYITYLTLFLFIVVYTNAQNILVTIAEDPGQQSSTVSDVAVFDFDSLTTGRHSNVVWEDVGIIDELLVHEGYFGFGAYDPSDGLNSRFNWNGWAGWSGSDPIVSATTITLNERSAYFGLYWSAGDGDDILQFYDGDTLVAEFSTNAVVQSASLTQDYYGDPNHNNQWQPHLRYNHIEPYAFINFYGDANTKWDKVILTQTYDSGSGFETDNISSRVDPVLASTDDVSSIGTSIGTVSGTETTVTTSSSYSWSFETTNDEQETTSTETESGGTTSETTTSESDDETTSGETETEESTGTIALTSITKGIIQSYQGLPLSSGDVIEYTITITNAGDTAATNVSLEGTVPSNTTYSSGTLVINDISQGDPLDTNTLLVLDSVEGNSSTVIVLQVVVNTSLPSSAKWITSEVEITYDEETNVVDSDNDPTGHCGIVDDGYDTNDTDSTTIDDDPTKLPLLQGTQYEESILAFEDLKNAGWNDWDMNDIILQVYSFYIVDGSDNIEYFSTMQQILARGAGMDSRLFITIPQGGYVEWQSLYLGFDGSVENTVADGNSGDTLTVELWESSKDALPPYTDLKYQWGAANTERFDPTGYGKIAVLNVYFDDPSLNPLNEFTESPHDTWITASSGETIHRLQYDSSSSQVVLTGPLFGRSLPFAQTFNIMWNWPAEGQAIWLSHPDYVNYLIIGGEEHEDWYLFFNRWRVWWDDQGYMPDGTFNDASSSIYWNTYVDDWSSQ